MYGPPMVCMYGVPGNFFTVDGTVTDSQNNPIKGIKVKAERANSAQNEDVDDLHNSEAVFTDENGVYHLSWNDYDSNSFQFIISAEDVDGEANGSYDNKTINVSFSNSNLTGHTDFGNGEYDIKNNNIQLNEKSTTQPQSPEN